ncbi:MAG: formate hydrogenlyase, partial [Thermofilum sp. ex4484_79]
DDLKRLLAYSSISQMGYMLFGVASVSVVGVIGAVLLYVSHGLAKAVLFMISGVFMHELKTRRISELRGLAGLMPVTAVVTLIGFLSLAGVPPLLGFWSEIFIFAGSIYVAISGGIDVFRLIITSTAVVMSVLTAGYGLWTIKRVFYGEPSDKIREVAREPYGMLLPAVILTALTVILGIYPTMLVSQVNNTLIQIFLIKMP